MAEAQVSRELDDDVFDPEPEAPIPPADNECCDSGCERCVWTVHAEETAAWRARHAAWLARQKQGQ